MPFRGGQHRERQLVGDVVTEVDDGVGVDQALEGAKGDALARLDDAELDDALAGEGMDAVTVAEGAGVGERRGGHVVG